jgi:hypothetical protein
MYAIVVLKCCFVLSTVWCHFLCAILSDAVVLTAEKWKRCQALFELNSDSNLLFLVPTLFIFKPLSVFFFFFQIWGLNSGPTPLALLCEWFFWDRVSWTVCLGWLGTLILLISASWVARITGVSHWCLTWLCFLDVDYWNWYCSLDYTVRSCLKKKKK